MPLKECVAHKMCRQFTRKIVSRPVPNGLFVYQRNKGRTTKEEEKKKKKKEKKERTADYPRGGDQNRLFADYPHSIKCLFGFQESAMGTCMSVLAAPGAVN